MNIFYCEKCGFRVPEADIASGAAVPAGPDRFVCTGCSAPHAPPKAPVSGRLRGESTASLPPPARTRALLPPPAPKESGMSPAALWGGVAASGLLVLAILLAGRRGPPPRPALVKEAPPPSLALPTTSSQGITAVNPPPPPKPPVEDESPRDTIARRDLGTIQTWRKEQPGDPYGYAERLDAFIARNRTTKAGQEAERLLAELTLPSRLDRPLAHWPFDETGGTSARDAVGANAATLKGQVRFVPGRIGGGAVAFGGGTKDCVDLGSGAALNFGRGAPFSIAGWFKTSAEYGTLVSFRNSGTDSTAIDIAIGNHGGAKSAGRLMTLVRQDGGTTRYGSVVGKAVNDGAWHHFALTRSAQGTIRLFLDGALQGLHANAESGGAITTDLRSCGLEVLWTQSARPPDASGQGLKGEMDDVRIYDCALAGPEVRELAGAK